MVDAEFELMVSHLEKPAQRGKRRRGYLAITWTSGCVIANGTACTTLAELVSVTRTVR